MKNPNPKARKVLRTLKEGSESVRRNPSPENYRNWENKIEKAGNSSPWGVILIVMLFLCIGGGILFSIAAGTATVVTYQESNISNPPSSSNNNYQSPSNNNSNPSTSNNYIQPTSVPQSNPIAKISCANNLYKVNLRRTPGYINKNDSSDSIYEVPCGEYVELLGDTKYVDDLTWWRVYWNGYTGWMADHTGSGKTILIFDP